MRTHTPGKIFLADQRGLVQSSNFRRYCTFSFGAFQHAHKQPPGHLLALNEETLAGGYTLTLPVAETAHVVLLPLTGTVEVLLDGRIFPVEVEEIRVLTLVAGSTLQLRNPYPTDLISLLHIWVRAEAEAVPAAAPAIGFSFAALANQLAPLLPGAGGALPFGLSLGRFAGRYETICAVPVGRLFFAFVLAGAFEAEGRLLHEKDGLTLWDAPAPIELEALSNDALLLVLDVAG